MCGIVVAVCAGGGLHEADVAPAVHALMHRGPDGNGVWRSADGRAVLGHTRLAVIDLAGGQQPMHTPDDVYHLVANAEFYGYEAIREQLQSRGHRLSTRADTEIALHLYAEQGVNAMTVLRGEFAFAIWDDRRGELFAARDRFGIKPLYYAQHRGRVYLASEIKALLALGVPARWDVEALAEHLLVCLPADRTLFAGIRQVPPGSWLRTDGRTIQIGQYWDLDLPTVADLPTDGDRPAHLAAVEAALVDAVRIRMRADVPIAYHLSGGLDSGSIVGVAARFEQPATFTVRFDGAAFDGAAFDEGEQARLAAASADAKHTEISFSRQTFASRIEETVARGEMVQENSHGIARLMQSEAIRQHGYAVVLAGEGGDELFAGYPQSRRDLALSPVPGGEQRLAADRAKLAAAGAVPLVHLFDRLGFLPAWIVDRYLNVGLPIGPLLRPAFAAAVAETRPCLALLNASDDQVAGRSPFHQSTYLFAKTWLCNYLLAAERLDMAHALEVRLPFLDHHLHDTAKLTPLAWYADDSGNKPLLRDAMSGYLAPGIARLAKKGFLAPPAVTDDAVLLRMGRLLAGDALDALPFFQPGAVRALVARLAALPPARRVAHERLLQIVTGIVLMTTTFGMSA